MKIKTTELTGPALDWAVAKAWQPVYSDKALIDAVAVKEYHPSSDWAQGGPIIEREKIAVRESKGKWYAMLSSDLGDGEGARWTERTWKGVPSLASKSKRVRFDSPTPLEAAMRCYVASKLGDEVDIPEELK